MEIEDFDNFDLVLAMDATNVADLYDIAPHAARHKIRRFLEYAPHTDTYDVPDPYLAARKASTTRSI